MEIKHLRHREDSASNSKSSNSQIQFQFTELIGELNNKNLPDETVDIINKHIE